MASPPTVDLRGQAALVTGGSSGIGAGIAKGLAAAGAQVAVNYRGEREAAEKIVEAIRAEGGEAFAVRADVSREEDVERMVAETVERFGTLHILVANAGLQKDSPAHELSLADWNTVIGVNLTGQFLCCRAAIREFLGRRAPNPSRALGKIICVSSVHEVIPWAGHVNYAASKGGVMLMMKTLAQEYAAHRIRINGIAPGAIRTPINRAAWETPEAEAALLRLIPYGRVGEPDDIAKAAVWLASDESDYVTGASLFVDGGMSLYPEFREGG
jgi:glucose 1-dehydrogenase